jgi:hypothetical protein
MQSSSADIGMLHFSHDLLKQKTAYPRRFDTYLVLLTALLGLYSCFGTSTGDVPRYGNLDIAIQVKSGLIPSKGGWRDGGVQFVRLGIRHAADGSQGDKSREQTETESKDNKAQNSGSSKNADYKCPDMTEAFLPCDWCGGHNGDGKCIGVSPNEKRWANILLACRTGMALERL